MSGFEHQLAEQFEALGMSPDVAKLAARGRGDVVHVPEARRSRSGMESAWSWRAGADEVDVSTASESVAGDPLGAGEAELRRAAMSGLGMSERVAASYARAIAAREQQVSGAVAAGQFCREVAANLRGR